MHKSFKERNHQSCPRCGAANLKTWRELTDDEKILAAKMPPSADYSSDERKRHLFCPRCWFEETVQSSANV